ncbi:MAG: serine/threonine protein kinase [Myxococcaceae bacterium]|nr:serine/threonine protein kinase [Myxococcaceae bacterium]
MAETPEQDTLVSGKHRIIGGRYILERQLGAGGMGTVWRASQLGVGNLVAIKFLNEALSHDEGLVKRFEQEAKVSLEVMHPGAAQLLDTGRDPKTGQLFIVFEYVEGEDLRARLARDGALPFDEAREIALRVGEVLAAAHARGVVHRDIKPENIRLRRDLGGTHVKVLDFGIAKFRPEANARLTADGAIAGTPGYMAPEQVRAEPLDGRADVYALGLVTYEMVTGLHAFASKSAPALLVDQMSTPMPTLLTRAPGRAFPELDAVLQKACAKDPAQRYQTAKDFVQALKALPSPPWSSRARPAVAAATLATPAPASASATAGGAATTVDPTPSRLPLVVALLALLGIVGGGGAFGLWKLAKAGSLRISATPAGEDCPGIDMYKPELRALSTAELEARVSRSRLMPPSLSARQLDTLRGTANNYDPAKRDCMYRLMLIGSVAAEGTTLSTTPELWGQTREVKDLEALFLEMPLKHAWTVAQRRDVLAQIEALFIANLKKDAAGDEEHWRRQYYGLELLCEAADETLEQLQAKRPGSCLDLSPR